jgi:hypothetical protein
LIHKFFYEFAGWMGSYAISPFPVPVFFDLVGGDFQK